jgi:hypothetical protein
VIVQLAYLTDESLGARYGIGERVYKRPVTVDVDVPVIAGAHGWEIEDPQAVLESIWSQFNRHDSLDQHPDLDRLGLRSLSVGDVIILGDTAWEADIIGWTPVEGGLRYER